MNYADAASGACVCALNKIDMRLVSHIK